MVNEQCKQCIHKDVCAYAEHYEDALKSDGVTPIFFVTIDKERYDVTELVKRDVPDYYNREVIR